jgi:hypothetical protein
MEATTAASTTTEIHPERLYTAQAIGEYLGLSRDSVYQIPDRHLPRTRVGPKRGRVMFKGRDVLAYEERMTTGR